MRRRTTIIAGSALLVASLLGGSAALALAQPAQAPESAAPSNTTEVLRGDLAEEQRFTGVLGFGPGLPVSGSGTGIVTDLPELEQIIRLGEPLYLVDEQPVRAFHGEVPLYRTLERGMNGRDVAQLKASLRALGYAGIDDTDEFDWETEEAVLQWQFDQGLDETGMVGADQIAFVPGDVRVSDLGARVGGPAQGVLLNVTTTTQVVTVPVAAKDTSAFVPGTEVRLSFGPGQEGTGVVRSKSPAAAPGSADASEKDAMVDVIVDLVELPDGIAGQVASADVTVSGISIEDVLSVPVSALTVDAQGILGVEIYEAGERRFVPVEVELYAAGRAAVTGRGIEEGTTVVVPR